MFLAVYMFFSVVFPTVWASQRGKGDSVEQENMLGTIAAVQDKVLKKIKMDRLGY